MLCSKAICVLSFQRLREQHDIYLLITGQGLGITSAENRSVTRANIARKSPPPLYFAIRPVQFESEAVLLRLSYSELGVTENYRHVGLTSRRDVFGQEKAN